MESIKPGSYSFTDHAKEKPITLRINNVRVALGKQIEIKPQPPKIPYLIRLANQEEMADLYNRNEYYKKYIQFTPAPVKNVSNIQKSDSGSDKGSGED